MHAILLHLPAEEQKQQEREKAKQQQRTVANGNVLLRVLALNKTYIELYGGNIKINDPLIILRTKR